MNKTSVLAVLMLILSALAVLGDVTSDMNEQLKDQFKEAPSVDECVAFLRERFQQVSPDRLTNLCERYASSVEQKGTLRERARALIDEKLADSQLKQRLDKLSERDLSKIQNLTPEEIEKLKALGRARFEHLIGQSEGKLKEELSNIMIRNVSLAELYRNREIAKARIDLARQRHQEAKQNYQDAKQAFDDRKGKFLESARSGNDKEAGAHAKEMLLRSADMVISSLEKVRSRVEDNDDLTEEEASAMIAEIDAKIAEMQGLKEDVASATTKQELKDAGKAIVSAWKAMQPQIKLHAEKIVASKVGEILQRSERLEMSLDRAISRLEEEGLDVSQADSRVSEFSAKVDSARQKFREARQLIESRNENLSREEKLRLVEEARTLVRQAHEDLNDAHEILKLIVADIKQNDPGFELEEEEEAVVVEESPETESPEEDSTPQADETSGSPEASPTLVPSPVPQDAPVTTPETTPEDTPSTVPYTTPVQED